MISLFKVRKDGGPESKVTGYWLIEIKWLFSIVLLRFGKGSREAFHNHAFNSISWVLSGGLWEEFTNAVGNVYGPSWKPIMTRRSTLHRVWGLFENTWVLSFRGPWSKTWQEYHPIANAYQTLTHGRKVVSVD